MENFLLFIEEDIESKKTLFSTMPTNNKANVRKYNEKLASVIEKYQEYKLLTKKYLESKSKSFIIKEEKDNSELTSNISKLSKIRFMMNPSNTYFEKMGFDTLFYQISNYHDFKFSSLSEIINFFLDKFKLVNVNLQSDDFDYTYYVKEFMRAFLNIRDVGGDYESLTENFESIYWVNPQLVEHISLNFRKLIKKHDKKFIEYIKKAQQEVLTGEQLDYEKCIEKLSVAYRELKTRDKETISDVVELARKREIDINNFFADSKVRMTAFTDLAIDQLNFGDASIMENFYDNLSKLSQSIEEFDGYLKFIPLIEDFKKEYVKEGTSSVSAKTIREIESQIQKNESKLEKLNRQIFSGKKLFTPLKDNDLKELKFESVKQANELIELYEKYNLEYFKEKVSAVINSTFSVADLLHLYYSFDYFKKMAIKKVYEINNYEEVMQYSNIFDSFEMNPTNVIIKGISLYEENNIAKVIVNKYRLVNININEEDLVAENLSTTLDRIKFLLRVNEIEKSELTVEKIWFIAEVHRLINRPS